MPLAETLQTAFGALAANRLRASLTILGVTIGIAAVIGMVAESLAGASLVLFRWVGLDLSIGRLIMMPVHLIITYYL